MDPMDGIFERKGREFEQEKGRRKTRRMEME
jgi:hypothetical protein